MRYSPVIVLAGVALLVSTLTPRFCHSDDGHPAQPLLESTSTRHAVGVAINSQRSPTAFLSEYLARPTGAENEHFHYHSDTNQYRGSFFEELFAPATHTHFSRRGTPLVHLFLIEPATLHRDFFLDYRVGNNVGGSTDEQELEAEIEWALTKRLGIIIEAPFLGLNPDNGSNTSGFGDLAIAGRALLVDGDTFFLSANLEVETATGNERRGLGRGEAAMAPSITTWLDLGNWTALHGQFGTEFGLESGDTELIYGLALTHTFQGPVLFHTDQCGQGHRACHGGDDDHVVFDPGMTSLILEMTGATGLSGDEDGQTFVELLPGISYIPVERIELRFGVRFPLFKPTRLDTQYIFTIARVF